MEPATALGAASLAASLLGSRGKKSSTQTTTPTYGWQVLPSGARIWAQTGGNTTTTEGSATSPWDAAASGLSALSSTVAADDISTKLVDAAKNSANYKTTSFTPTMSLTGNTNAYVNNWLNKNGLNE